MFFPIYVIIQFIFFQICKTNYQGYRLLKVNQKSQNETNVLNKVSGELYLDTWSNDRIPELKWLLNLNPNQVNDVEDVLLDKPFQHTEENSNLVKILSIRSVPIAKSSLQMDRFYSYDEIVSYIESMQQQFQSKVSIFTLNGTTIQGNRIKGIKITNGDDRDKPIILIEGGIHAREWISPAMTLYLMEQLIDNDDNKYLTEKVDWFIVPVLNPDGYEYTRTKDRMWRKNLSPGRNCIGVDLNRNWGFHWNDFDEEHFKSISNTECAEMYVGPSPFSEIETASFANFVLSHKANIKLYLAFHCFGKMIFYPETSPEIKPLAIEVANAIEKVKGTKYIVGAPSELVYKAPGNSHDWMKEVARIPLAYTIELPGLGTGFDIPAKEIKGIADEMFEGVKVFHNHVEEKWGFEHFNLLIV